MYKKQIGLFVIIAIIIRVSSKCTKCFPPEFIWGTSTSAYQIEGGWNSDGKSENIWDWFSHNVSEKIADGSNADIAADSYHRYDEDVDLLKNLGVNMYRFSISWARVLPNGTTDYVNEAGVNYYINLLKKLQENNITPLVTIYHWDLPMTLQNLGGWFNPDISDYFAEYSRFCYETFGSYVKYWLPINEIMINCYFGFGTGQHAPGITKSGTATYKCFHSQLLAHAKSYRVYNETFKSTQKGHIGINLVSDFIEPLTESAEDMEAAENYLLWDIGLTGHPVIHGNWPSKVKERIDNLSIKQGFNESRLPEFSPEEIELIHGTFDYLAVHYYSTAYGTPIKNISNIELTNVDYEVDKNVEKIKMYDKPHGKSNTFFDVPTGFRGILNWIFKTYGDHKILITENGWTDGIDTLNDTARITYIQGHLCNLLKARVIDKINIIGYSHWSLLDSYEWSSGYTEAFGLVKVDATANLTRIPKESYYYYQNIIKSHCIEKCAFN